MFTLFRNFEEPPPYRPNPHGPSGIFYESVGLQNDDFIRDLTGAVTGVREAMGGKATIRPDDEAVLAFEKVIMDHTGIKVSVVTNQILAAIVPLYANENHALLDKFWHDFEIHDQYLKRWLKESAGKKGYVDDTVGKVGGIYSTYEHTMFMDFGLLFKTLGLSDRQVAAVASHEVGHAYTYIKFQHLTTTTNQVLQRISQEVTEKDPGDAMPYVLREMQKLNKDVTGKEVEALLTGDRSILVGQLTRMAYGGVVSQLPTSRYDDTSSEQLADSFATRHGAGKDLAEALYKIHVFVGSAEVNPTTRFVFRSMEVAMSMLLMVAMPAAGAATGIFGALMFTLICWVSNSHNSDMTYDELRDRMQRVRNEMVTYLKREAYDKVSQNVVLEQIDAMDKLLANIKPYSTLYRVVGDFFSFKGRAAKRTINYQRGLEDIASSELFVMAARLTS